MKQVYGKVSLEHWNLLDERANQLAKHIGDLIKGMAEDAIKDALVSDDTRAWLPAVWGDNDGSGGAAPDDPLAVYFHLDMGKYEGVGPILKTSIKDMLNPYLEDCVYDGSYVDGLARIRDGMIEMARRIDAIVSAPHPPVDHRKRWGGVADSAPSSDDDTTE